MTLSLEEQEPRYTRRSKRRTPCQDLDMRTRTLRGSKPFPTCMLLVISVLRGLLALAVKGQGACTERARLTRERELTRKQFQKPLFRPV